MPTITTGMFFLARQRPSVDHTSDGEFRLSLRVNDNQGQHRVEPYLVTWTGNAAKNWWQEHQNHLQAGQPLALELHNPRAFPRMHGGPETHAAVIRCELAPVAPSWLRRATPLTQNQSATT
jgi:hypothetical protein